MVTEDGIEACLVVGGEKLICSQVASIEDGVASHLPTSPKRRSHFLTLSKATLEGF
jgi:hypothetical protein